MNYVPVKKMKWTIYIFNAGLSRVCILVWQ